MNNFLFPLLRYLCDANYDTTLLLLESEHEHFLPENDTFNDFQAKVKRTKFSVLPGAFWNLSKEDIKQVLNNFDVLIGTGPAPAICTRIGRPLDLFIPYGSDIYYFPFVPITAKGGLKKAVKSFYFSRHQFLGIKKAKKIMLDYTNESFERMFTKLNTDSKRFYCNPPFFYTPEFSPTSISNCYSESSYYQQFKKVRDENDLVVFQHGRQEWQEDEEVKLTATLYTKGNQKLLYAFAEFLKITKLKAHLVLFEYGSSYVRSKKLVADLGIESHVTWMPLMPRKEIMVGISLCDIGVGELDSSYFSYGAVYEFLAMAKPVIHYRKDELYKEHYPEMYPMYSANSKGQVLHHLMEYEKDPTSFKKTGTMAHEWFVKNAIEKPLNTILNEVRKKENSINRISES